MIKLSTFALTEPLEDGATGVLLALNLSLLALLFEQFIVRESLRYLAQLVLFDDGVSELLVLLFVFGLRHPDLLHVGIALLTRH